MNINTVKIRNIIFGEGNPKICVPIVGTTKDEIRTEAFNIKKLPMDIVEWRVDWYEYNKDIPSVIDVAKMLRDILGETPILFTIRTNHEGGEGNYTNEEYENMNIAVVQSGYVDVIDVEVFIGIETVTTIIEEVHKAEKRVIASNHDFQKTPKKEEIIRRLTYMQELGADILKIAVMPQNPQDVLVLLDATREMVEETASKPVVTMSMGAMGVISRVSGGTFGSAMTFGAGKDVSAPGQMNAVHLKQVLELLS